MPCILFVFDVEVARKALVHLAVQMTIPIDLTGFATVHDDAELRH